MKRFLKLLMLLVLIPFVKVNAVTLPVTISPGTNYSGDVYWFGEYDRVGNTHAWRFAGSKTVIINGKKYGIYHVPGQSYNGSYNGKSFNTVCIDPGASEGGSNYTCQSISNANLEEILKNKNAYGSGVAYMLAVRFLAAEAGLSTNTKVSSMYWYKTSGYDKSIFASGSVGSLQRGQGSTLAQANSIVNQVKAAAKTSNNTGTTKFTSRHISGSGYLHTFEITSNNALMEVPTVECVSGCNKINNVNWAVGSKTGTIVAEMNTANNNCSMVIKIKYKASGEDGGLYFCSPGSGGATYSGGGSASNEQKMVAYITNDVLSAGGNAKNSLPGNNANSSEQNIPLTLENCENKCKDCNITTHIDYSVDLCCEGSDRSYAYEPKINEIFCTLKKDCDTTEDINVPGANDTRSGDYLAKNVNTYCKIYCTEKVNVKVPSPLNSKNGKYFSLKGTSVDGYSSDGPIIWGNYACRNIIRYDKWINDYVQEAENVASKYNEYQKAQALSDIYNIAYEDGQAGNSSFNVPLSYSCSGCSDGHCTTLSTSSSCTANYSYDKNIPNRSANYKTAKIRYGNNINHAAGFYELESIPSNNGNVSVSGGLYNIHFAGSEGDFYCTSYDRSKNLSGSVSWCTYESTSPITGKAVCTLHTRDVSCTANARGDTSGKPTDINKGGVWDSARATANANVSTTRSAYTQAVANMEALRKQITDCDDFFNTHNDDSFVKEKIQPANVTFNWFFVYISVDNYIKPTEYNPINYQGNCQFTTNPEYNGNYDTDGRGLESPHYDTKNSHNVATLNIFDSSKNASLQCNNDSRKCAGGILDSKVNILKTAKSQVQKYTSDTLYKYYCTYKREDGGNKFTAYPYGGYYTYNTSNANIKAAHKDQLYVEYSVLYGTYQTFWRFSQIGSKNLNGSGGKFDEYFKSGTDCANNGVSGTTMDYYCKLKVESSLSKIKGCNEPTVTLTQGNSYWSNACCTAGSCKSYIDDTLTFAFKIVDPTNIFPGSKSGEMPKGKSMSGEAEYAQNWFRTDAERKILKTIQDTSGNDELYNPKRVTYQFQLNAKALKTIKEYNASKNDYNSMDGKYTQTDSNTGALTVFESNFITNYYNGKIIMPNGKTVQLGTDKLDKNALSNARSKVHFQK